MPDMIPVSRIAAIALARVKEVRVSISDVVGTYSTEQKKLSDARTAIAAAEELLTLFAEPPPKATRAPVLPALPDPVQITGPIPPEYDPADVDGLL